MHVLNFLVAILLPYITLFSKLSPPGSVPIYFFSEEAAFVAGEFGAIVFYWMGFLRNYIKARGLTERKYFWICAGILIFYAASKIIYTLPYTWITNMFAFGLGVLSATKGQGIGKKTLVLIISISVIIFSYSTFILLGLAWWNFTPGDYYYFRSEIIDWLQEVF